jgi:hypothetical protein
MKVTHPIRGRAAKGIHLAADSTGSFINKLRGADYESEEIWSNQLLRSP